MIVACCWWQLLENKRNKSGKKYNADMEWRIFDIRVGEADYKALQDYETVKVPAYLSACQPVSLRLIVSNRVAKR